MKLPTLNGNAVQALAGTTLAAIGVACQFGVWYGLVTAGLLLVFLAALARD